MEKIVQLYQTGGTSEKHVKRFLSHFSNEEIEKINLILISHHHWDHIFGSFYFNKPVLCPKTTGKHIKEYGKVVWNVNSIVDKYKKGELFEFSFHNMQNELDEKNVIFPKPLIINGSIELDLGGVNIIYEPIISCHCEDAYIIYIKEDKTLFMGDIIWPNMEGQNDEWFYSYDEVVKMYEKIKEYNAQCFIDAHAKPLNRAEFYGFMDKLVFMLKYSLENKPKNYEEVENAVPEELKGFKIGYDEWIEGAVLNCR